MSFRTASLWFHRYTGLVMAVFLILTSVTGMFLAFHDSLDDWFNRDYLTVEVLPNKRQLPITDLHQLVQRRYPQVKFSTLSLQSLPADKAVSFGVDRERDKPKSETTVAFQTVYINPYTAEIIGTRNEEEWAWRNTMSKVFLFHRNLLLGDIGELVLGIVALLWTLNCFIGVYLTLPRTIKSKKNADAKTGKKRKRVSAFKRWLPAWKIRRTKNIFKLSFDAHHALSLWLWVMMFVLAWSSVGFNLHPVYKPVMAMIFPETKTGEDTATNKQQGKKDNRVDKEDSRRSKENTQQVNPVLAISMSEITRAKQNAEQFAIAKGVSITEYSSFSVDRKTGAQTINFKTNLDTVGRGSSIVFNTQHIGEKILNKAAVSAPLKPEVKWGFERSTKDSVSMWLVYLHRGFVWGTSYKIFLTFVGLATAIVSGTGVYLWWRGRQARLKRKARINK